MTLAIALQYLAASALITLALACSAACIVEIVRTLRATP